MNKTQLLASLAIGNLCGAVIWNPPAGAWDLATWFSDSVNEIHDALAPGRGEAQTPLPVPQNQPPIGNSSSAQPCLAPPPMLVATDQGVNPAPPMAEQTRTVPNRPQALRQYKDPKAKILMNIAPGNKMSSLLNRVSYPDRFDSNGNYWDTEDGTIAVNNDENDRVTAIWIVQ